MTILWRKLTQRSTFFFLYLKLNAVANSSHVTVGLHVLKEGNHGNMFASHLYKGLFQQDRFQSRVQGLSDFLQ